MSMARSHIDLLLVPESLRNSDLDRKLLRQGKEEAARRGCLGAWHDTSSRQARDFA